MKVIWLHQPYPTLIELEVKGWETRGGPPNGPMRPDGVRGMPGLAIEPGERVAIVAAQARPADGRYGSWSTRKRGKTWSIVQPGTHGPIQCDGCPHDHDLPLGVVVCTAVVAEALPIIGEDDMRPEVPGYIVNDGYSLTVHAISPGRDGDGEWVSEDISDQLPYGDWTPGRRAWRLTDVESVPGHPEPVVARGNRHGVCEIEVTW